MGHEQREFTEFYEASRDTCLRAVTAAIGDREQAEDLVAEAYARAWASWRKVSRYSAPAGWVVRVALNARISGWRRRRREIPLADPVAELDRAATAVDSSSAGSSSVDSAVLIALRKLPTRQREVVALRVFLDLDTQTAADVLGIAPGTVTAHLSRAVKALRDEPAVRDRVPASPNPITALEVSSE